MPAGKPDRTLKRRLLPGLIVGVLVGIAAALTAFLRPGWMEGLELSRFGKSVEEPGPWAAAVKKFDSCTDANELARHFLWWQSRVFLLCPQLVPGVFGLRRLPFIINIRHLIADKETKT